MPHDNPNSQVPNFRQMAVKVTGNNLSATLGFIETTWNNFLPATPFQQEFMEQKLADLYQDQAEQRTKEIGIRKVLGSSTLDIVRLLTWDFSKLVLLANVIAWPAAWYFMSGWLENFAYRTSMDIGIFIFAALLAWLVAAITVGSLAAITANLNPTL